MGTRKLTDSQRKNNERQRRKDKGMVRIEIWTWPELKEMIKMIVDVVNKGKG